ncbi:PREDICTED: LOW QUALITY PROTEIN: EF-hand and coiled-coil domain-containing protein 1 [Lipotes vexillifer]|uniref:LOW QUALITY PROTEIN: EF-hand and coiled-coil domain-containing protein 1 n=1 Tax=Lipotes vexillifer TaxID=118797 RepID=A0A340XYP3_LIPVE|nr:PREDICTED: LOW QUALITY PROTEIN: EF-hand and coiled-coil domain-containing protein 1 [Lipotes vexillifer]
MESLMPHCARQQLRAGSSEGGWSSSLSVPDTKAGGQTDALPGQRSPRRRSNQTATAKPLLSRNSGAAPGSGGAEAPEERRLAAMEPSGPGTGTGVEGAAGDPYQRPARRTQWLLSALAHHYGLDRGVENEIVVLATGLDQYLQEVFHHLDCRGAGRLPRADFRALCAVLGLRAEEAAATWEAAGHTAAGDTNSGDVIAGLATDGDADAEEEARLALRTEPPELTFRQFHARLCGYFGTRAGPRLPRGALSEHMETQIRLRRPRRRRRAPRTPGPDGGPDSERLARLEEENSSLRELVEDLRAALQSSDARCLALQVGLWKSQAGAREAALGGPEAAAARELRQARGALSAAEARAGRLRRGPAEVRRRAEEARQAVLRSLARVRELEALARQVPGLQRWARRLEGELRRYRSEDSHLPTSPRASPEPQAKSGEPQDGGSRGPDLPPEGAWGSDSSSGSRPPHEVDEQLFRSVEGQAASDEEDDSEKRHQEQGPPAEVKALLAGLSSCGRGCDDKTAKKLTMYLTHFGSADRARALGELEQLETQGCSGKTLGAPGEEVKLQQKADENEHLRLELQMVETERVRLCLLGEKLEDVLRLLRRLRDLNISKRALGKILLSTLDACRDPAHEGTSGPSAMLDALHRALAGCELLRREPLAPASAAPALSNSLLISC